MADTRQATGLTPEQWDNTFYEEYIQDSPFKSVMGTNENSIIQMVENFKKGKGDAFTVALVNRLTGRLRDHGHWQGSHRAMAVLVARAASGLRLSAVRRRSGATTPDRRARLLAGGRRPEVQL